MPRNRERVSAKFTNQMKTRIGSRNNDLIQTRGLTGVEPSQHAPAEQTAA
jgi:hypothetical protein